MNDLLLAYHHEVDEVLRHRHFVGNKAKGQIKTGVANLKTGVARKQCQFFQKTKMSVVKNVRFFEKFGVLCFLVTPVLRFVLLPYYQRVTTESIPNISQLINAENRMPNFTAPKKCQ